ncbi:MAG: OmpA/MotB domain protein, partial [Bacteroidota bacterium]|nr:OmpA/MotB domain protein [Bacteroidota bacterium]
MKPTIKMLLLLALLANGAVQAANMQTLTIYFDKDKAYLTNQEAQKLQMLKGADYILLKGHTDNDGGNSYNIELSRKRVDAVKAFVRNLDSGIKVEADYFGESKPINSNVDEKEKTQNRRVEITYVSDPLMRTAVPVQQFEIDNG